MGEVSSLKRRRLWFTTYCKIPLPLGMDFTKMFLHCLWSWVKRATNWEILDCTPIEIKPWSQPLKIEVRKVHAKSEKYSITHYFKQFSMPLLSWEILMCKLLAYFHASSYIFSHSENLIICCSNFPFFFVPKSCGPITASVLWMKLVSP